MMFFRVVIAGAFYFYVLVGSLQADPEQGKILFKEKRCDLCHDITLPGTEFKPIGPGLQGVSKRHDKEWVRKWLSDPAEVWKTDSADVQDINERYFKFRSSKPQPRESFMATVIGKQVILTPEEIERLIEYLWVL